MDREPDQIAPEVCGSCRKRLAFHLVNTFRFRSRMWKYEIVENLCDSCFEDKLKEHGLSVDFS